MRQLKRLWTKDRNFVIKIPVIDQHEYSGVFLKSWRKPGRDVGKHVCCVCSEFKMKSLLYADLTKTHKVIFPFGSDSGFNLMQRRHGDKLGGVTGPKTRVSVRGRNLLSFSLRARPWDFFLRLKKKKKKKERRFYAGYNFWRSENK